MFDPDAWIEHLDRHGVDYIMVGATQPPSTAPGARRPTFDIDVVPRWDTENLTRLCVALREVDAVSTTGPRTEGTAITPEVLIDREIMTWNTSLGRIDTMVGIPDAEGMPVDYEALEPRTTTVTDAHPVEVLIADLGDIVTSKIFAGRRKDTEALPELRRLLRAEEEAGQDPRAPRAGA